MKKIILISLNIFICLNSYAQPNLQWAKNYSGVGTFKWNASNDMVQDNYGNVITAGTTYDTSGTGNSDIVIIKYDTNGNILWLKTLDLTSNDTPYKIGVDNNNDVIIVGAVANPSLAGFIAKYTASGNFLWSKIVTPINSWAHWFSGVQFDASNNIYTSGMGSGIYFSKLSPTGTVLWTIDNPEGSSYQYYSIVGEFDIDNLGNIYISGVWTIDDSVGWEEPNDDLILSKYDTNGNLIWMNTDTAGGRGSYLTCQPVNGVICSGGYIYVAEGMSTPNPLCAASTESKSVAFSKYDQLGNLLLRNEFMCPGSIYNFPMKMEFNGADFFIGGITTDNATMLNTNFMLLKADMNCNLDWIRNISFSATQDELYDLAIDPYGNVFGLGTTYASSGYQNAVIMAYDNNGNQLWQLPYNSLILNASNKILLNSSGIYISLTEETVPGITEISTVKFNYLANVDAIKIDEKLQIFPNPNNGKFSILNSSHLILKSISIVDIAGKEIFKQNIENQNLSLDISNFENGCYFFVANFNDGSIKSEKFIVAK